MRITKYSIFVIGVTLLQCMVYQPTDGETNMGVKDTVVKLTYFGPQNKTVSSLVFSVKGMVTPVDKFKELKVFYGNDKRLIRNVYVRLDTLSKIINVTEKFAIVKKSHKISPIELRVVVLNVYTNELQQIELDRNTASEFFKGLHSAFEKPSNAWEVLRIWGSRTGFTAHTSSKRP